MKIFRMRWMSGSLEPGKPGFRAWVELPNGKLAYSEAAVLPWEGSEVLDKLREQLQEECRRMGYDDVVITFRAGEEFDYAKCSNDGAPLLRP